MVWTLNYRLLFTAIFISGASALIYQLIWVRLLGLVFGVSSFAVATVVAVFLLGLGLGRLFIYWLRDGIDLTQWADGMELAGMRSIMYPHPESADFVMVAVLSMLLGVFASLYPAWRATRIKPLEALRR